MHAGLWALIIAAFAICLWAALQSQWASWRMLLILVAIGGLLYLVARRRQAKARSAATVSSIQPPPSTRSPS